MVENLDIGFEFPEWATWIFIIVGFIWAAKVLWWILMAIDPILCACEKNMGLRYGP
jgi:hypothetical protein